MTKGTTVTALQNVAEFEKAIKENRCGKLSDDIILLYDIARPYAVHETQMLLKK